MTSGASAIAGMLIFGTSTVVVQKFLFEFTADGLPQYPHPHSFNKPWFQTFTMFVGMFGCLIVYELHRAFTKRRSAQQVPLLAEDNSIQEKGGGENGGVSHKKVYLYVIAPALCDLLATGLMNIGLLWIPASIWQMLRGSMVIFSAIMCVTFLKRKLYAYNWFGVGVCITALVIVGISCLYSDEYKAAHDHSTGPKVGPVKTTVGMFLVVFAQIIQASQIVIEDFLLHDVNVAPLFIVGLEGLWGMVVTAAVFLPIVGAIPGVEGGGIHEDTLDTFAMLGNDSVLILIVIIYSLCILAYNGFGMAVTSHFTAVHRTILEAMRTAFIWMAEIVIYYSIHNTDFGRQHPNMGEEWNGWSYLQLAGFLLLTVGMLIYNKIIKIGFGFYYPPAEGQILKNEDDDQA